MRIRDILQIVFQSVKDTFKGRFWKFFLGSFGPLAALLLFGKNFLNTTISYSIVIGMFVLSGLFILRFLLFFITNLVKKFHFLYKESIYGEAIVLLKNAFSEVHYLGKLENFTDEIFIKSIITLCNELKKVFDKITKASCSVSIKVSMSGMVNAGESVVNLCRDSEAALTRDTDTYKAIDHTILGNTPYQIIVNNFKNRKYTELTYVNSDINPKNKHYLNTSQSCYQNGIYPYKSELVHLLFPIKQEDSQSCQPLGFLCIDCNEKNKFNSAYDRAIVEGVADGIYNVIIKRNIILKQKIIEDAKETA